MINKDLIHQYYKSLDQKDSRWQELWDEEAAFSDASQTLNSKGRSAIIQSFTSFLSGVTQVTIRQLIIEQDSACVIVHYYYKNAKGESMDQDVAEIWEVKNEKLWKLTIYFDLTSYRNFIRT